MQRGERTRVALLALVTLASSAACAAMPGSSSVQAAPAATPWNEADAAQAPPRILLVRHAETTADGTRDPALSDAGRERAERLARVLADAGITRVLSTNYRRTRGTAEPIARAAGVTVEPYDPGDLAGLARALRAATGVVLVVGHSNTTPDLVRALGR